MYSKCLKKFIDLIKISFLAFISAANYCIFVFPNHFAPAGIDGICTMIQDVLNINMGYLSLFINIPLIIFAFIILNHDYAIKTSVYIIVFSISIIFIKENTTMYYFTQTGTSTILSPIASGVIRGIVYAYTLNLNGSAGGVDIISSIIKIKKPHLNFMDNIFIINTFIAISSFWVYDRNIEPVICSIIYAYISSYTCNHIRNKKHEIIKYEIITKTPSEITSRINHELHQKATIINAKGAFSGEDTNIVLCIISKNDAPFIEKLLLNFPDCVTFKSYASDSISGITYK